MRDPAAGSRVFIYMIQGNVRRSQHIHSGNESILPHKGSVTSVTGGVDLETWGPWDHAVTNSVSKQDCVKTSKAQRRF